MGCVESKKKKKKIENEETVRRCKERKRLMKQLMSCRAELAFCHFYYLRSLNNTGSTLRQFTDYYYYSDPPGLTGILSPPPPPPPPPHYHFPQLTTQPHMKENDPLGIEKDEDDDDDDDDESCSPPPPPPPPLQLFGSACEFWDPFGPPNPSSSNSSSSKDDQGAVEEQEDWAEANVEFREEEAEENDDDVQQLLHGNNAENVVLNLVKKEESPLPFPSSNMEEILVVDDDNNSNSSAAVSLLTMGTDMLVRRRRRRRRTNKSLVGIVKEIDDYFLKAASAGNHVLRLLLDSHQQQQPHPFHQMEQIMMGKSSKSAKVFSALSWNWSHKSPHSSKDACGQEARDVNGSGNHCATLEHLYAKEQRLYKEVKEEELVKVLHRKKTLLLQKLEARDSDCTKTEELRLDIENLHSRILSLQESINETCLSISKLRDEELHPQLTDLTFGLLQMWRMMYECHQVQNHIAQQANLLDGHRGLEPVTEAHRFATAQLEAEVTHWYNSFCNLLKSQHNYVQILNQWVELTDCLPDTSEVTSYVYGIRHLCEEWWLSLDRLPDKVAAEAIKSFLAVIHSILLQQKEELKLQKKSHRLECRLEKELTSSSNLDKHEENSVGGPALTKKLEALTKMVEEEKSRYINYVRNSRAMMLNNLQTGLPNVFQALMSFAGICVQAFEGISVPSETTSTGHLGAVSPSF